MGLFSRSSSKSSTVVNTKTKTTVNGLTGPEAAHLADSAGSLGESIVSAARGAGEDIIQASALAAASIRDDRDAEAEARAQAGGPMLAGVAIVGGALWLAMNGGG